VVYDSLLTGGPLRGATVYVIGMRHRAHLDQTARAEADALTEVLVVSLEEPTAF
jgi:hypothetical protein